MSKLAMIARILLGLILVVFGLNGFLHFIPAPPMEGPAAQFMGALFSTGYLYFIKAFEVVGGVLLLTGMFPLVGVVLVTPGIVNIVIFHLVMAPAMLPMALVLAALDGFYIWHNWKHFKGLLVKKV